MRTTFLDPELDAQLDKDGYVVVPLIGPDEVAQLNAAYDRLGAAPGDPQRACIDTFHCFDTDYKDAVHAEVEAVLNPAVQAIFDRHKSLSYCYIQKWPGQHSGFGLHQDISVLDETKYRSVEVWVALTDTNEVNGQLWITPGSHKWAPVPRGIHRFPPPYMGVEERIIRRHSIPVPMKAGEAVIFHHATYHFSFANQSDSFRLVAATDMIPVEAQHLHYVANDKDTVNAYEIEETFWVDNNPFTLRKAPETAKFVEEIDPSTFPQLTDEDLDRLVAEGRAVDHEPVDFGTINPVQPWCHRCGSTEGVDGWIDPLVGNATLLCPRCAAAQARMAGVIGDIDPELATNLEVEGWATMGMLDADGLAVAQQVVDSLDIPAGTPFFASNRDASREDATRVARSLQDLFQPVVDRLLPGYRVFKGAVIVKDPNGDNPVGLHQDWEYVDERYHRSYTVWVPLEDACDAQGGLHVVPRSHRWLDNHRGSGDGFTEPFSAVADEVMARGGLDVPLTAGEGVVYDSALLHFSNPNRGGRRRAAVAVAIAPPAAPVVHFVAEGTTEADVYEIRPGDPHFTDLPFGTRPESRSMRTVDVAVAPVTSADLDQWLPPLPVADARPTSPDESPTPPRGLRRLLSRR